MKVTLVTSNGCKCCEDFRPLFNQLKEQYPMMEFIEEDINETSYKDILGVPALFVEDKRVQCFLNYVKLKNELENKVIDIINNE